MLINLTHLFYDVHAGCRRNPFSCVDSTVHKESLFVLSWFAFQLKYKQRSEKDKALKAKFNYLFRANSISKGLAPLKKGEVSTETCLLK